MEIENEPQKTNLPVGSVKSRFNVRWNCFLVIGNLSLLISKFSNTKYSFLVYYVVGLLHVGL